MFVKQAYEKRLKKQEEILSKLTVLKKIKQPKIGSVKNDKLNYDKQEQFFSKDDIPFHARTIKQKINQLIDPDHLGLKKKEWNTRVSVPLNLKKQQTHEQKLLKVQLIRCRLNWGFMDNPILQYSQQKMYDGTDTRNDYTNWNVSNQILFKKIKQNLLQRTSNAFENTKMRQEQFLSEYMNPLTKTTAFIEAGKQKVEAEAEMRKRLGERYIFQNPTASEEKINAAVFKLAYETLVKEKKDQIEARAMKTDFKANLSLTQKTLLHIQFTHSGAWQRFPSWLGGDEQLWGWSCCQNQSFTSRGCTRIIKDRNKWNLSSFNNS